MNQWKLSRNISEHFLRKVHKISLNCPQKLHHNISKYFHSVFFTQLTNDIVQIVDILYHNLTPYPVEIQNFENIESEKYRYWVLHSQRGRGIDGIVTLTYQSKPIENAFEAGLPHFSKHVVVPSGIVSQKVYIENVSILRTFTSIVTHPRRHALRKRFPSAIRWIVDGYPLRKACLLRLLISTTLFDFEVTR